MATAVKSSLSQILEEVYFNSELVSVPAIAEEVLGRISQEEAMEALEEILPTYLYVWLSRKRLLSPAAFREPTEFDARAEVDGSDSSVTWRKQPSMMGSWAIRLRSRIKTEGGWKMFKYCTRADVLWYVGYLHEVAEQTLSKSRYYEAIAEALALRGDDAVVGDLPDDPTQGELS